MHRTCGVRALVHAHLASMAAAVDDEESAVVAGGTADGAVGKFDTAGVVLSRHLHVLVAAVAAAAVLRSTSPGHHDPLGTASSAGRFILSRHGRLRW